MEEWRSVTAFPAYEVSSLGRVRRIADLPGHPLHGDGIRLPGMAGSERKYPYVALSRDGHGQTQIAVHRLVAIAFHGPAPTPRHQVNHIDGDTTHNAAPNLEWVTPSENQTHSARTGLANPAANLHFGERHHNAKLTALTVREIRALAGTMSQEAIGARFGISQTSVSKVLLRHTWKAVV